jgi:hypothetical protein
LSALNFQSLHCLRPSEVAFAYPFKQLDFILEF